MTLTLNIPPDLTRADAGYRAKLRRAADALRDADLITEEQAAELTGEKADAPAQPPPLRQGSEEWKAELRRIGETSRRTVPFTIEETSREALYGDDMR